MSTDYASLEAKKKKEKKIGVSRDRQRPYD
jgi:hypothetical protein